MCGSSPVPNPTPEVLTREKLNDMLAEVANKAGRALNAAPVLTMHGRDMREIVQAIQAMKSKLATMTIPTNTTISNPAKAAGMPLAEIQSRLEAIQEKAHANYLKYGAPEDMDFSSIKLDIYSLRRDLENRASAQPTAASAAPARTTPANEVPAETMAAISRDIEGVFGASNDTKRQSRVVAEALTTLYYRLPRGASLEELIHRLSILARSVDGALQSQQPAATSSSTFDLTEEQEKHILRPDLDDIAGLAESLVRLWEAAPEDSHLENVLDGLSDAARRLEGIGEDDNEDHLSEETKDKVLNRIRELDEDASPLAHVENLQKAIEELYDRAPYGSDLEAVAEGLGEQIDALVDALDKAKEKTGLDIKLTVNGQEIRLSK